MESKVLHIIDNQSPILNDKSLVIDMNNSDIKYQNSIDILDIFTMKQKELKSSLLNFTSIIYNTLQKQIEDKEILKYLLGSLIFEKSPYKTDSLYLYYKLNIIVEYINKNCINHIELHSTNKNIVNFFTKYCITQKINLQNSYKIDEKLDIKAFVMKNSTLSYLYKFKVEAKKISQKIQINTQKNKKLVVSYYPNYYFEDDEFINKYFMDISKKLNQDYDWLFIYADDINNIKSEEDILDKHNFNQYNFLDTYIDYKDLINIYILHKKLIKRCENIDVKELFIDENSVDYFNIFIDDWKKSLSIVLLDTLIFEKKFKNYFQTNKFDEIIYLMEYQPWEQMLIKQAKKDDNTLIKGIVHSVIRPNLLNYFYSKDIHNGMYLPDLVGVNSDDVKQIMIDNGFKNSQLKEIEAQRFIYLSKINLKEQKEIKNNLLITTSIDYKETKELLETFAKVYNKPKYDNIYIKAHPDLPIDSIISSFRIFPMYHLLSGSMSDAFDLVDTVYTANTSSVLLESLLNGKKTITLFSLGSLPMPAVSKHPLLRVATNKDQLKEIIYNTEIRKIENSSSNLLYLSNKLHRWDSFIYDK